MRVISGKFRGRKLRSPSGLQLRPTSDRLKETLFDILGPAVSGTILLDVFAGTGAVGLEALSRGAREVVFIESGRKAADLIRRNLELCGVTTAYRIIQRDGFAALRALGRQGRALYADRFDLAHTVAVLHGGPGTSDRRPAF